MSKTRSRVWKHFTKKENGMATCSICNLDFSYRSSVSNLRKHLIRKHGDCMWDANIEENEDHSSEEEDDFLPQNLSPRFRKFFSATAKPDLTHCRLCDEDVVGGAVELTQHLTDHHKQELDSDEKDSDASEAWAYFSRSPNSSNAVCLLCDCSVSFRNGVYYLKRHLRLKHPKLKINMDKREDKEKKTLIISANGELYEVETEKDNDEDNQMDPINTVYLDEYEELVKPKITGERLPLLKKRRASFMDTGRLKKRNKVEERGPDNCSGNEVVNDSNKEDCLGYFTKYLVSFMKDLPKRISDKLQVDMLKLVLDAKMAHIAQNDVDYNITVLSNDPGVQASVTVCETQKTSGEVIVKGDSG